MTEVKLINKSNKPPYLTFDDLEPGEYFVKVNDRKLVLRKSRFVIELHNGMVLIGNEYNCVFVETDNFCKVSNDCQVERVKNITIEYEME